MSFKLEEICEELSQIQIPMRPEELESIGVHVVEDPSDDEVEGYEEGTRQAVRACMAARRRLDARGRVLRPVATDAILSGDAAEAYIAWQLTDSYVPYSPPLERKRRTGMPDPDRESIDPYPEMPEGFVGPGDSYEYGSPDWETAEWARDGVETKSAVSEALYVYHHLPRFALELESHAPELLAFVKQNKDRLLDLLWETDDHRRRPTKRPELPAVRLAEAREDIERYLDELVVAPAVRAAYGDPTEARRRVREALRLFCNGGEAPPKGESETGKRVKGFGLDPKILVKASQLEGRFQRALEEYHLRQDLWRIALKLVDPKSPQLMRANPSATFAQKVVAGTIHSFPRKWKEERIAGRDRVIYHPADWDEALTQGIVAIRTEPVVVWVHLAGGFGTAAEAVRFLNDPETRSRLSLLGPNWIEELKKIVFGAYKKTHPKKD